MTTKVEICNLALTKLGETHLLDDGGDISANDDSKAADECRLNYIPSLSAILESREWTFATARFLVDVDTVSLDLPTWNGGDNYYLVPSGVLKIRRVYSNAAMLPSDILDNWRREGKWVYSPDSGDELPMIATILVANTSLFSPMFVQSFACYLAAAICMSITENETLEQKLWGEYDRLKLSDAAAVDGSQGSTDILRSSQLVGVRYR